MSDLSDQLAAQFTRAQGSDTLLDAYFATQDQISEVGNDAVQAPTKENIEAWLKLYAKLSSLAVEEPAEITLKLREADQATFDLARQELDQPDRVAVDELLSSLQPDTWNLSAFTQFQTDAVTPAPDIPILVNFAVNQNFDGTHTQLWQGTVTVNDRNGGQIGTYTARTGGFVADFRTHNGPTPPGYYRIVTHIPNVKAPGMKLNGVAFCFTLHQLDGTRVYGRSGLCLHPDQAPPGTHGCIGIFEPAERLQECEQAIADLLRAGPVGLSARYGSLQPDV